ncbi:hypothetical protein EXS74_02725 [Candidatus Woesearchaeota archaeon]|nr:hypothetical protein [Candidatus Woesearchaeota archaeon]
MVILNKKGMDISLNFIILAVLALIALIVIALFFTGGLTNLFGQTEDVGSIGSEKVALYTAKCNFYCSSRDKTAWNNPQFPEDVAAAYQGCPQITGKDYDASCCNDASGKLLTGQDLSDCKAAATS